MCGLAGFLSSSLPSDASAGVITEMLARIRHRGPDGAGYFLDDGFAMGTVRLAVVDLVNGVQPMSDPSERYWICFNGEIYNYVELRQELEALGRKFRTAHSDTEVVLKAWVQWGNDCFARFTGAFACAIYDTVTGDLVLARDRDGGRPLFYAEAPGGFVFASEMKAFREFPGFRFEFDERELATIYGIWTPLPDRAPFKNIHQVPIATALTIRDGQGYLHHYDRLNFDVPGFSGTEDDAVAFIRDTLHTAVEMRLRTDVEVGVYLSGGLDSSIVTSLATELSPHQVRTFSVAFDNQHFDESNSQQMVAKHLGTTHSAVQVGSADIADNFLKAVYHTEMPTFRTSFVPMYLLSRHVRDSGIKTILSGEGADEAFLGYSLFRETLLRNQWHELSTEERSARLAKLHPELSHFGAAHQAHLLGLYQQFATEQLPGLFSHELRYQNGKFAARLLADRVNPFEDLIGLVARTPEFADMPAINRAQWLEYKTLLPGFLLSTQGERVALAHSVENRCPFMDPAVIRAAASVNLRYDDGQVEKAILKKAFKNVLPEWITQRPKQPYRAPGASVFKEARPDYLDLLLSDSELGAIDAINHKFARRLVDKIMSSPVEEISTKEDQAFIYLLTTVVLHQQFVRGQENPDTSDFEVTVAVDNRKRDA